MIELKEVLTKIKAQDYRDGNGTFQILFLKANREEKTGGQWVNLQKACAAGLPPNCKGHEMIGIKCMGTGKRYAVHIRLIFQLNKIDIYWR